MKTSAALINEVAANEDGNSVNPQSSQVRFGEPRLLRAPSLLRVLRCDSPRVGIFARSAKTGQNAGRRAGIIYPGGVRCFVLYPEGRSRRAEILHGVLSASLRRFSKATGGQGARSPLFVPPGVQVAVTVLLSFLQAAVCAVHGVIPGIEIPVIAFIQRFPFSRSAAEIYSLKRAAVIQG